MIGRRSAQSRVTVDEALNSALEALARGEKLDDVLEAQPRHARRLRPLLVTAQAARAAGPAPASHRLAANYAAVRDALHRECTIKAIRPFRPAPAKRMPFTAFSVPASMYAMLMVAAISGVAGATVAIGPSDVVPGFVQHLVTNAPPKAAPTPADSSPAVGPEVPPGGGASEAVASDEAAPVLITLNGRVSDLRMGGFTLASGDNAWEVSFDGETAIEGELAEGAALKLGGYATGANTVHADSIEIAGAVAQATNTRTAREHTSTPQPADTSTPPPTEPPAPSATPSIKPKKTPPGGPPSSGG